MRVMVYSLSLLAFAGVASAQDNPACAKYENALAYNACLAKLGPKAGATRATAPPAMEASSRTRGLLSMSRSRHGRVEAVFSIPPGRSSRE